MGIGRRTNENQVIPAFWSLPGFIKANFPVPGAITGWVDIITGAVQRCGVDIADIDLPP